MSTATRNYVTREEVEQLVRQVTHQAVAEELDSLLAEFGTQMRGVSNQMLSLVREMRQIVQQSTSTEHVSVKSPQARWVGSTGPPAGW